MYLDVILPASFPIFQAYDIMLCDASCDHGHMPLHCPKNKRNRKEKNRKIKSKKID